MAECRVCNRRLPSVRVVVLQYHSWELDAFEEPVSWMIDAQQYELCVHHYLCLRYSGLRFYHDIDEVPYPIDEELGHDDVTPDEGEFLYGNNGYEAWHDFRDWIDKGVAARQLLQVLLAHW